MSRTNDDFDVATHEGESRPVSITVEIDEDVLAWLDAAARAVTVDTKTNATPETVAASILLGAYLEDEEGV